MKKGWVFLMDDTKRQITKIAREVGKFTVQTMKEEGIGTAEFDVIHLVRHNPGITQTAWRIKDIWFENRIRKMEGASCFMRQKKRNT